MQELLSKNTLFLFLLFCISMYPDAASAQNVQHLLSDTASIAAGKIKNFSFEELMDIEVTTVSKRPEKLTEVAAAIQVITQEDIHRSGATNLPEALRLSPNLQVAQYSSFGWVISARGFNNVFSNKLLVMIDGRTVYSPLFAGVYWDAQSVLLEDVERIEVISGPGGSLWGANAVNGVINIITKNTKDTQGLYLSAAAGNYLNNTFSARYGGHINDALTYKVFLLRNALDQTLNAEKQKNTDDWNLNQGGIRIDYDAGGADQLSFQGNMEVAKEQSILGTSDFDHQDIMGQWSHAFSAKSDLKLNAYYDRSWRRDLPSTTNDQLQTYDIDLQHNVQLGKQNNVLWGAGYRLILDHSQSTNPIVGLLPPKKNLHLYSGFIQDEILLVPDALKLTVGTKFLHNDYSGFEVQPSVRFAWTPTKQQTVWASFSRAVRTPSRLDVDYHLPTYPVPANSISIDGGPDFVSEKLVAYELGYRVQPNQSLSFSIATFYNKYDDLYSVEPIPGTLTYRIQNGMKGSSEGIELSGVSQILKGWRIRGGYTYFHKKIKDKPGHTFDTTYEGTDPDHQVVLQSMLELPKHFQLDITGRYVSSRPLSVAAGVPEVPQYANLDVRLAWYYKFLELSVVGQNIANPSHVEFSTSSIPRSFYGKITCRF